MAGQELGYLSKEQDLIEAVKLIVGAKFIGDDCAQLPGGLLLSADTFLQGTHFLTELASMSEIGWKAMAVNLSDVAAMAGLPRFAVVALTLPGNLSRPQFLELYGGIAACASLYDTAIVGGDITCGAVLSLTITVVGEANRYGCLTRQGAKPGDEIVVTGQFGASAAALEMLLTALPNAIRQRAPARHTGSGNQTPTMTQRQSIEEDKGKYPISMAQHFRPMPRFSEAWQFVKRTGQRGALMDTSDGLADGLAQIARSSKSGMRIELTDVPIHPETRRIADLLKKDSLDLALYGGEDYELVGCLPNSVWQAWQSEVPVDQIPFKRIGQVTDSQTIELLYDGQPGPKLDLEKCFQHIAKVD
jgi:thiamine-monophosphate kinase